MNIETNEINGATVITLGGEVDLEHSPQARKALLDAVANNKKVIVDLSGVSYIDSSGIASLVEAFQTARKNGGAFILATVSDSALRVLQLARLDKVFTIAATVEEATA